MSPDPRWLEILKSSGGQSFAAAVAAGALLIANAWVWIPPLPDWAIQVSALSLVLFGGLALVSFISALDKLFNPRSVFTYWFSLRKDRQAARAYIPHMTPIEREIIGYLLYHNQTTFTGAVDGGYAVTLVSRGLVTRMMLPGQQALHDDVPWGIPNHIWTVLIEHQDSFPYHPPPHGMTETHPWRVAGW